MDTAVISKVNEGFIFKRVSCQSFEKVWILIGLRSTSQSMRINMTNPFYGKWVKAYENLKHIINIFKPVAYSGQLQVGYRPLYCVTMESKHLVKLAYLILFTIHYKTP